MADDEYALGWPAAPVHENAGANNVMAGQILPGFRDIPRFDIRNGDPSEARSILVRPTIPQAFHWAPVGGISYDQAVDCVEGYIKCAYAQSFEGNPPNLSDVKRRKLAIAIGTARAVMTTYYKIKRSDLIGGEAAPTMLNARVNPDNTVTYTCILAHDDPKRRHFDQPMNLTDEETSVISQLVLSCIGIPALQGWSLGMTGHHYLSDPTSQSRRAYKVVEAQFWKSQVVESWFNTDPTDIQDWVWHKSGHPINLTMKTQWAESEEVAKMIRLAGAGAAAARLPLIESPLRAANTYKTLMETVNGLLTQVGGSMSPGILPDIIFHTQNWARGTERKTDPIFTTLFDESIRERADAVAWLGDLLARNRHKVAWAYGFYNALSDNNQLSTNTVNTLKQANSLEKLKTECLANYTEGYVAYNDYMARKARMRAEGKFEAPVFSFEV